jgi:hypothetical protein
MEIFDLFKPFVTNLYIEAQVFYYGDRMMGRVKDPAHPHRCKGAAKNGQCMNEVEPGSEYCKYHGGRDRTEEINQKGYWLSKAQDRTRLANLSDHLEPVKELRDAIGIQHMLIERRWNAIKDDGDLLQACGPLNQMLQTMERLITSCHKIETNLGQLLAKQAIFSLAKRMVEIIVEELEGIENYEEIVDTITSRLIETVQWTDNSKVAAPLALPAPK